MPATAAVVRTAKLTERQFGAIARAQDTLRDAENAVVASQKALTIAQRESEALFALICEAHEFPEGSEVVLNPSTRELSATVAAPPAPPAPPAP